MDFSNVKTAVLFRVGALLVTIFSLAFLIASNGYIVTELILIILLGLQVISLIKYVQRGNEDILEFLESIENDDITHRYKT
ncbi:MAG: ATP-binding protein, partial [Fulvivirga sp.]